MFKKIKNEKQRLKDLDVKDKFKDVEFEKNDGLALFIAAMVTFIPPLLAIFAVTWFFVWILFLR